MIVKMYQTIQCQKCKPILWNKHCSNNGTVVIWRLHKLESTDYAKMYAQNLWLMPLEYCIIHHSKSGLTRESGAERPCANQIFSETSQSKLTKECCTIELTDITLVHYRYYIIGVTSIDITMLWGTIQTTQTSANLTCCWFEKIDR